MMRLLVTGGTGLVGWRLVKSALEKNFETHYTFLNNKVNLEGTHAIQMDISKRNDTIKKISNIKPDVTIHTAGLTAVDQCEKYKELANKTNVEGTRNVVDACKKIGSKVVYISTSFVFDGQKKKFNENDKPNPINHYGFTKLQGEKMISASGLDFLITRIDQPYSWIEKWQKKTTVVKVLEKLNAGEIDEEPTDWYNKPNFNDNLCEVILKLIEKDKNGIYHTVGSDFLNRYEWSLKIAKVFGKDKKLVKPITSEKLDVLAKRSNANLSNKKAEKDSGIRLVGVEEGLRTMLEQSKDV